MIDTSVSIILSVISALPLIISFTFFIIGKAQKRAVTQTVEFYPPDGFSPIDVMTEYYADFSKAKGLFNPLMLYWAENGFIKIEEDCRRGLKLTKLKNLTPPKGCKGERLKTFELEKDLFDNIFGDGEYFYTLAAQSSYKKQYDKFANSCEAIGGLKTNWQRQRKLNFVLSALSVLAIIINTLTIGLIGGNTIMVAMLFPIIGLIAMRFVPMGVFKYLFFAVWGGLPFCGVLVNLQTAEMLIMLLSVGGAFITLHVVLPLTEIRKEDNLKIYARLKGFKNFLVKAEKPQLEMLVEENPNYYFDILPYCYILKITKKVKAKFDKIRLDGPAPYLADGDFGDYRDTLMF